MFKRILFSAILFLSITSQAHDPERSFTIDTSLFYSDFLNPNNVKKSVSLKDVVQVSSSEIGLGIIDLKLVDTSLGQLDLEHISRGEKPTTLELYAIQILYAAQRATEFYRSIGIDIGPVQLRIQDPSIPPMADRLGNTLSFAAAKTLDKVEGSVLNVSDLTPMISDIVFHEVTHMAQGRKTLELESGRLGTTSYEGHANLMAYLISGRTDLGILPGQAAQMVVKSSCAFGYEIISSSTPFVYRDYEPFSSVLVQVHDLILSRTLGVVNQHIAHFAISRIYADIVLNSDGSETYQGLVLRILAQLKSSALINEGDFPMIKAWFSSRGLDLDRNASEGYIGAILINGFPPDRGTSWLKEETIKSGAVAPLLTVQDEFFRINPDIQPPVLGVLVSEKSMGAVGPIMQRKLIEAHNTGESLSAETEGRIYQEALVEAALGGVDIGGIIVKNPSVELGLTPHSIQIETQPSVESHCMKGSVVTAPVELFDQNHRNFGQLTLPFICQ